MRYQVGMIRKILSSSCICLNSKLRIWGSFAFGYEYPLKAPLLKTLLIAHYRNPVQSY